MSGCEFTTTCHLLVDMKAFAPDLQSRYETEYCWADHCQCARFVATKAMGPEAVPFDLLPSETARANLLIEEMRKRSPDG